MQPTETFFWQRGCKPLKLKHVWMYLPNQSYEGQGTLCTILRQGWIQSACVERLSNSKARQIQTVQYEYLSYVNNKTVGK
jgi:hypothetical protein